VYPKLVFIGLAIVWASFFLLMGCTDASVLVPPFTVCQLVNKGYDSNGGHLDCGLFFSDYYDGNFFSVVDGNIVLSASSATSWVDLDFPVGCSVGEYVQVVGASLTCVALPSGVVDTNCEVNNSCLTIEYKVDFNGDVNSAIVPQQCAAGYYLNALGDPPTCALDVSGGGGLSGEDVNSIASLYSCPEGEALQQAGGDFVCIEIGLAGNPAGNDGEIQFNDGGNFGASENFKLVNGNDSEKERLVINNAGNRSVPFLQQFISAGEALIAFTNDLNGWMLEGNPTEWLVGRSFVEDDNVYGFGVQNFGSANMFLNSDNNFMLGGWDGSAPFFFNGLTNNLTIDKNVYADCFVMSDDNAICSKADLGQTSNITDTNWQTSWSTFDANMKDTYRKYSVDLNTSKNINTDGNIWASGMFASTNGFCASGDCSNIPSSGSIKGMKLSGGLFLNAGGLAVGSGLDVPVTGYVTVDRGINILTGGLHVGGSATELRGNIRADYNMYANGNRVEECVWAIEKCWDEVDNDCDGLTDCADTVDCPSSNPMCAQPVGIIGLTLVGNNGQLAADSASTSYGWTRQQAVVIRNNSSSQIRVTQIDLNALTACWNTEVGSGHCIGSPMQIRVTENTMANALSSADVATGVCNSQKGMLEVADLEAVFSTTPKLATLGGLIDLSDYCTVAKTGIFLEPNEIKGAELDLAYPDWCLGNTWGTAMGAKLGVKFYLSDGTNSYIQDVNTGCSEGVSDYTGAFSYLSSVGWGQFPNAFLPSSTGVNSVTQGSPPIYKVKPSDQSSPNADTNVSGLSFNMQANKLYAFECYLDTNAFSTDVGIRLSMVASKPATWINYRIDGWSSTTDEVVSNIAAYYTYQENTTSQGGEFYIYQIKGSVLNGANSSTIQPSFRSETGNHVWVRKGSWCVYTTIGV
jgi:hypothetical protein